MATIVVSKTGGVLMTRSLKNRNPRGEQVGTEDMINHLVEVGHKVLFFGPVEGELPCPIVRPNTEGIFAMMSSGEQVERFDLDENMLRAALSSHCTPSPIGERVLWLESAGKPASMNFIRNPRSITVQMSAMRYSAPIMAMIVRLKADRVTFCTDQRAYPRDGEMTDGWPELRPKALLDMCTHNYDTRIAWQDYERRSVQCWGASWGRLEQKCLVADADRDLDLVGISHCHVTSGFRKKLRRKAWHTLLGKHGELFSALREQAAITPYVMYGEGWSEMPELGYPKAFPGVIDAGDQVNFVLDRAKTTPVISPENFQYLTSKPWLSVARGCLPVLATDCPHAWDPEGQVVPLTHPCRGYDWECTLRLIRSKAREEIVADLRERLGGPRWHVLDAMVDDWEGGLCENDKDLWYERYGGYRPR